MEKEAFAVVAAREQQLWRGGGIEERTGITSGTLEVEEREFERILIFWLCFHLRCWKLD